MYEMSQPERSRFSDDHIKERISAHEGLTWDVVEYRKVLSSYVSDLPIARQTRLPAERLSGRIDADDLKRLQQIRYYGASLGIICGIMLVLSLLHGAMPPSMEMDLWRAMTNVKGESFLLIGLYQLVEITCFIVYIVTLFGLKRYSRMMVVPFAIIMPVTNSAYAFLCCVAAYTLQKQHKDQVPTKWVVFYIITSVFWVIFQAYIFYIGFKYIRGLRRCTLWDIISMKQGLKNRAAPPTDETRPSEYQNSPQTPITSWEQQARTQARE